MGWNDHVEMVETECLDCGVVDTWQCWNEVAKARYVGEIGRMLGVDVGKSDRCPNCGSTNGKQVVESDDEYLDRCFWEAMDKDD